MSRKLRQKSHSGIYHVLMQGVSKADIFKDHEDCEEFINILSRLRQEYYSSDATPDEPCFSIYAYSLMPNYFHLLIKEGQDTISEAMARIAANYSHYVNNKNDSDGTIYRGRFDSEPVEDATRLHDVLRYIHQAPLALDSVPNLDAYPYSSWHEYVHTDSSLPAICDIPEAYQNVDADTLRATLSEPLPKGATFLAPRKNRTPKPTEAQVIGLIRLYTGAPTIADFQTLPYPERLKTLKGLLSNGASIRQLERITGIGRGVIQNL